MTKLRAIDKATGKEIEAGMVLRDFRGEPWTFIRATRATQEGRSGKVLVLNEATNDQREFYSTVFDCLVQS